MTSDIFKTWLHDFDREMLLKGRKVLMLVDNCPAHPVIQGLRAVELLFLPPNCTSVLQPMDQGIIFLSGREPKNDCRLHRHTQQTP